MVTTDLNSATLGFANLSGADLHKANLSGADLSNADLTQAKGLADACGSVETKLPRGLTVKPCPSDK